MSCAASSPLMSCSSACLRFLPVCAALAAANGHDPRSTESGVTPSSLAGTACCGDGSECRGERPTSSTPAVVLPLTSLDPVCGLPSLLLAPDAGCTAGCGERSAGLPPLWLSPGAGCTGGCAECSVGDAMSSAFVRASRLAYSTYAVCNLVSSTDHMPIRHH